MTMSGATASAASTYYVTSPRRTMGVTRMRRFPAISLFIGFVLSPAQGATDDQMEQLKAQVKAEIQTEVGAVKKDYEDRIKKLEERISTLEADNAQLRGQQAQTTPRPVAPTTGEDIAALKQRIAELEQARSERRDEMSGTAQELASMKK